MKRSQIHPNLSHSKLLYQIKRPELWHRSWENLFLFFQIEINKLNLNLTDYIHQRRGAGNSTSAFNVSYCKISFTL